MSESVTRTSDPIIQSAARWFWWIAGLSLVNTIFAHSGSNTSFVVGLGITAVADAIFINLKVIAFTIDAVVVGFFFFIGLMAMREKAWAFYIGLGVYALDALIYVRLQDWMPVAFHGLAIVFIVKGVSRLRTLAPAAG